ncbi:MAG: hypothetical protein OXK76_07580 [Gammaproteobacteria bacterium]|nr:hypothetical protein [Gammaproteobacteria bacterium]
MGFTTARRKQITLTQLVEVSREISERSLIGRTERSASWDFERSSGFVCDQGLGEHIAFVSVKDWDQSLPLNSERRIFEIDNIVVRDLEIELDDGSAWDAMVDWIPVSNAKWHFERCCFRCPSPNMWAVGFPWRGSFRFHKNEFRFPSDGHRGGAWIFPFKSGSRVSFVGNDFGGKTIQTRCVGSEKGKDGSEGASGDEGWQSLGQIAFVANKRVGDLWIQEGYSSVEITGMNRIDRLNVDLIVDADEGKQTSIYLGPREKIDPSFHNCQQHRSLFLSMRRLAALNHDSRQLTVLDRQLERIEYFLNKGREAPPVFDFRVWIEYWQDRILYGWRRWSSDFYRSWLRPLAMLVGGYAAINGLPPAVLIDGFAVSHWIDLTLRPLTEIAVYEASLGRIVGSDYEAVAASAKTLLKLAGLIEVFWIGVWAFAFAKSIRR